MVRQKDLSNYTVRGEAGRRTYFIASWHRSSFLTKKRVIRYFTGEAKSRLGTSWPGPQSSCHIHQNPRKTSAYQTCHYDLRMHLGHLMWCPCRDEDSVTHTLRYGPTLHTVLPLQTPTEVRVQIHQLVMDGIWTHLGANASLFIHLHQGSHTSITWLWLVQVSYADLSEKCPYLVGIWRWVDVPQSSLETKIHKGSVIP